MATARQNGNLRPLPDYLRRGLRLLFVGYNPGLRSARVGHYYAGRGNQFWPFLWEAGLIPEQLSHSDDSRLLDFNMGLTDIVKRPTRGVGTLTQPDYRPGTDALQKKIQLYRPRAVAFVGKGVYKKFAGRRVDLGPQPERILGARVFVLPSTAGTNTWLTRAEKLEYFKQLAQWLKGVAA